jgi:hypothetical protein
MFDVAQRVGTKLLETLARDATGVLLSNQVT